MTAESHLHATTGGAEREELLETNLAEHDDAEILMERLVILRSTDGAFWPTWLDLHDRLRLHLSTAGPHPVAVMRGRPGGSGRRGTHRRGRLRAPSPARCG